MEIEQLEKLLRLGEARLGPLSLRCLHVARCSLLAKHVRYPIRAAPRAQALRARRLPPAAPSAGRTGRNLDAAPPTYRPDNSHARRDCGESSRSQAARAKAPLLGSAASERHRTKFRIGRPSYRPCVRTHTFMSSKIQRTNTHRNARVSALFCVSRQKLTSGVSPVSERIAESGRQFSGCVFPSKFLAELLPNLVCSLKRPLSVFEYFVQSTSNESAPLPEVGMSAPIWN
jgi:hypothetical protein